MTDQSATRWLIVNADDFGFTHDVNSGIVEAHQRGILTSTTLMANGTAFDDAVRLAKANPSLDIGCHLVLIGGPSLTQPDRALPRSVSEMLQTVALKRIDVYSELRAQTVKILDAGLHPSHLDTHKHTHLFPPVLQALARLAQEFAIPWIRRPFDLPLSGGTTPWTKRAVSRSLTVVRRRFHRTLDAYGCRTTDHFAGFQITGRFRSREVVELIRALPRGSTEFMCHPGHCGPELAAARTRLKQSRQEELNALTSDEVRRAIDDTGVRLTNYQEISIVQ